MATKKKKELTLSQKRNKDWKTWEMLCKEARKEWQKYVKSVERNPYK